MTKLEDQNLVLDSRFTEEDVALISEFIELVKDTEHRNILSLLESMRCDHCNDVDLDEAIKLVKELRNG